MDNDRSSQSLGRFLRGQLLQCPSLDGITAVTYYQRALTEPGATGLVNGSLVKHNKLAIHEQDIRTYLQENIIQTSPLLGYTPDWEHQRSLLIREFGRVLTTGIGTWQYDMYGEWFDAPEFWDLFSDFQQIRLHEIELNFQSTADVAVIVDDISQIYRPMEDDYLMYNSITMQRTPLGWMGAPYDVYFLDDLLASTKLYKCYFFLNTYAVDSSKRQQIHNRLCANQATAVWLYAPGIISDGTLSTQNITALTGFTVQRTIISDASGQVTISNATHPIINGIGDSLAGTIYGNPQPISACYYPPEYHGEVYYCPQSGEGVTILGSMKTTSEPPGLAVKTTADGWNSIYSAGLVFTPQLLRNILSFAGCFLYADDAATSVCANQNYISLFAKTASWRTLKLKQPVAHLRDMLSGEDLGSGDHFSIFMDENEARIFDCSDISP